MIYCNLVNKTITEICKIRKEKSEHVKNRIE